MAVGKYQSRSRRLLSLLAIIVGLPLSALAERLPLKTYTTADGLPRDYISRIVRDSRGFLWFCTPEGLSRFDGYTFVNYGIDQGLPHRVVNDLLEARDGTYWIATGAGLVHFSPYPQQISSLSQPTRTAVNGAPVPTTNFVVYHTNEGERAEIFNALVEDHAGVIWCGTDAGLYRLEKDQDWILVPVNIGSVGRNSAEAMVSTFMEDRTGALWIGTSNGLYLKRPGGTIQHYTTHSALPADDVRALLEDKNGQMWIGTTTGLYKLGPEPLGQLASSGETYSVRNGLASNWITSLLRSIDGRLWVGTQGGLSEYLASADDSTLKFRTYARVQGLSGNEVQSLAEDTDGNLWVGTESGGAMKLARNGFATYLEADGFSATRIASIFEDRAGELCVVSSQSTKLFIHQFSDGRLKDMSTNLNERINYGWGWNQIVFQDHVGEWWLPTDEGLYRFPQTSGIEQFSQLHYKAAYTTSDGLSTNQIFRLYEDSHGDIWISTITPNKDALTRWVRATGEFQRYSEADGIPRSMAPTVFREDASGQLWIGFYDGTVSRYRDGRFRTLTPGGSGLQRGMIRDLHFDQRGRLWIATSRGGVVRIDQPSSDTPQIMPYTTASGLASNQVTCLVEDDQERIYVGTAQGVDRLDPESGHLKHYTVADGLANNFVNVAYRDRAGTLWFGTLQGLSRLLPELEIAPTAPSILISALRIAGEEYSVSPLGQTEVMAPELSANQNDIQIAFCSVSVGAAASLRYQYKLEGADLDWSAPTTQRSITYARLSSGTYRFLVRAVSLDGAMSAQPAVVSFRILRPVWLRWWFISLAGLVIVCAAYVVHRYRLQRLLELERVRTRIATDLHDDIGSSLSRMAILSEVVKQHSGVTHRESLERLTDIADTARGLVDTMSDIVWSIDPRRDDLQSVVMRVRLFAADVFDPKGIKWELHSSPDLDRVKMSPEQRRHLFLIFKEALTNIVRHSDSKHVTLKIMISFDQLRVEIRDDGNGLSPSPNSGTSKNGRGGHGLENMRARAAQLRGQWKVESNPGEGTRVTLTMPINEGGGMNMLFRRRTK